MQFLSWLPFRPLYSPSWRGLHPLLFTLLFSSSISYADNIDTLQQDFIKTQEALSVGEMKLFIKSLQQMEQTYLTVKRQLSLGEREQFQLWLYRFKFKKYQLSAKTPPIRNIETFESINAIQRYTTRFENSLDQLQKALDALRLYNQLYNKIAITQRIQAQIRLQASLSTERDLELLTRQGQIYVALLRFAQNQWNDKKSLKHQIKRQETTLSSLRKQQHRLTVTQSNIRQEQLALVTRIKEAHLLFTQEKQKNLQHKKDLHNLSIVGIGLLPVGIGFIVFGGLFIHDHDNPNNAVFGNPDPDLRSFYEIGGPTFLAVGITTVLAGVTILITTALMTPQDNAQLDAVLKSQEHFLKQHEQTSPPTSWTPSPLLSKQKRITLGIFQ